MDAALAPTTFDRLQSMLTSVPFGLDPNEITASATLRDDLDLDSLERIEVIIAAEEAFNIEIDDDEAEGWLTVGDIVKTVDRLLR